MRIYYSEPLLEEFREPRARLDQHSIDHILPLRGHALYEANLLLGIIFLLLVRWLPYFWCLVFCSASDAF